MGRGTMIRDGPWEAVLPSWDQVGSHGRVSEQMLLLPRLSPCSPGVSCPCHWPFPTGQPLPPPPEPQVSLSLRLRVFLYFQTPSATAGRAQPVGKLHPAGDRSRCLRAWSPFLWQGSPEV